MTKTPTMTTHGIVQHDKSFMSTPNPTSSPASVEPAKRSPLPTDKHGPEDDKKPFAVFEMPTNQRHISIYLSDAIGDPIDYTDVIQRIKTAKASDVVYIHLNTPGGRVDTGIQIMNAMANTPAHVVTVLEGEACSIGSLIFLCGDEFVVNDDCIFMIHNYSGGYRGKGHELGSFVTAYNEYFEKVARKKYYGFLTEDEIKRVVKGEDFWFDSEEVRQRLDRMVRIRSNEAKTAKTSKAKAQKKTTKKITASK